jgi:hypothetical protein
MVIRLVIDFGELVKVLLRKGGVGKVVGRWLRGGGCWVLWPLCVFACIYFVVVEDACVRDCRRLGLYAVGTVG